MYIKQIIKGEQLITNYSPTVHTVHFFSVLVKGWVDSYEHLNLKYSPLNLMILFIKLTRVNR